MSATPVKWKPIVLFGEITNYFVSDKGQVRSGNTRILKPRCCSNKSGYLSVTLVVKDMNTQSKHSLLKTILVHRLVATAFLENHENKLTVNHIDHNPSNNMIENLEWATMKEQCAHRRPRKLTINNARNVFQIDPATNTIINTYRSVGDAAKEMGFIDFRSKSENIRYACSKRTKTAYGFLWRYHDASEMVEEKWTEISGFSGHYISSCGRYKRTLTGHAKTGSLIRGYMKMGMQGKVYSVHRIVAQEFIPNPQPGVFRIVNHKNGVKTDNMVDNLEWVTPAQNVQHAYDTGLTKKRKISQYDKAGNLLNVFDCQREAANAIGITEQSIYQSIKRNGYNC